MTPLSNRYDDEIEITIGESAKEKRYKATISSLVGALEKISSVGCQVSSSVGLPCVSRPWDRIQCLSCIATKALREHIKEKNEADSGTI